MRLVLQVKRVKMVYIFFLAGSRIALFQEPSPAWVKEYGWPAATLFVLLIILAVVSRALWPLIKAYVGSLQKQAEDAHALVKELLEKAEDRANIKSQEFLSALDRQREASLAGLQKQGEIYQSALEVHTQKISGLIGEQTVAIKTVKEAVDTVAAKLRKE